MKSYIFNVGGLFVASYEGFSTVICIRYLKFYMFYCLIVFTDILLLFTAAQTVFLLFYGYSFHAIVVDIVFSKNLVMYSISYRCYVLHSHVTDIYDK